MRRYVTADAVKAKTIDELLTKSVKPEIVPIVAAPEYEDTSIDDLLKSGIQAVRGAMKAILADIGTGHPSRETIQNLKDMMGILKDLKKEEKALLDSLTDEELAKLSKIK